MSWRNVVTFALGLGLAVSVTLRPDTATRRPVQRDLTVEHYETAHGLRAIYENMFTSVRSTVTERTPRLSSITINCTGCTAAALNVFNFAANIWATVLNSPVPMIIDVAFEPLAPGVLGSAGPATFFRDFSGAPFPSTFYPVATANARAGVDLAPALSDVTSRYSSTFNWHFGTDAMPPADAFDLVSVALHEFGHGLGFVGSGFVDGGLGGWSLDGTFPAIYDRFVRDGAGQYIMTAYPNNSAALAAVFTSGSLFFNSPGTSALPTVVAPAPLFAPNPFQGGSSYSHLDEATFAAGDPNSLMTPQLGFAEAIHQPGAITQAMFSDMGWPGGAVPPVPPPAGLPGAPTNFVANVVGNTINMNWNASQIMFEPADKAAATGYNLKARISAGGPVILSQPVGNVTAFSIAGPDGTFVLSVTGTNALGEGPESNQQTVTLPGGGGPPACMVAPNTPINVSNVVNGSTVTINWGDGGGCPATSYTVLAFVGGSPVAALNVGTALTLTVPGVPSGVYTVNVVASNAFGDSPLSTPTVVNVP